MTREEFIAQWRAYWSGVALCGAFDNADEGPLAKGLRIHAIPKAVAEKLGEMYDQITKGVPTNGNGKGTGPLPGGRVPENSRR